MNNPTENNYDITLQFKEGATQNLGSFKRVFGLVKVKQLVRLIENLDLDSNPRNSKAGSITADIIESLERYPDIFPLMSKGLLISAMHFRALDRDRYQLKFEDKSIEGVLDGGHNLLAVGLYVLSEALSEAQVDKRIGATVIFADFKKLYKQYYAEIDSFLEDAKNKHILERYVPIELVVPASDSDEDLLAYRDALPLIQQARNNNAQLKKQTLADHGGIFEELKATIDPKLRDLVEWKTNDGGVVDVRDLIALSWLPLAQLDFDVHDKAKKRISPPSVQQLYSSKATVLNRYVEFMEAEEVGRTPVGEKYELHNDLVRSALKITASLPNLFEQVCEFAAKMYDKAGPKIKFRDLAVVEAANRRKEPSHKFSRAKATLLVPDGFVWPVISGFRALMVREADGALRWGADPVEFLHDNWEELAEAFNTIIETGAYDPQKVGKSKLSYDLFYAKIDAIFQRNK